MMPASSAQDTRLASLQDAFAACYIEQQSKMSANHVECFAQSIMGQLGRELPDHPTNQYSCLARSALSYGFGTLLLCHCSVLTSLRQSAQELERLFGEAHKTNRAGSIPAAVEEARRLKFLNHHYSGMHMAYMRLTTLMSRDKIDQYTIGDLVAWMTNPFCFGPRASENEDCVQYTDVSLVLFELSKDLSTMPGLRPSILSDIQSSILLCDRFATMNDRNVWINAIVEQIAFAVYQTCPDGIQKKLCEVQGYIVELEAMFFLGSQALCLLSCKAWGDLSPHFRQELSLHEGSGGQLVTSQAYWNTCFFKLMLPRINTRLQRNPQKHSYPKQDETALGNVSDATCNGPAYTLSLLTPSVVIAEENTVKSTGVTEQTWYQNESSPMETADDLNVHDTTESDGAYESDETILYASLETTSQPIPPTTMSNTLAPSSDLDTIQEKWTQDTSDQTQSLHLLPLYPSMHQLGAVPQPDDSSQVASIDTLQESADVYATDSSSHKHTNIGGTTKGNRASIGEAVPGVAKEKHDQEQLREYENQCYYATLGVSAAASPYELDAAQRKLRRSMHPDLARHSGHVGLATKKFQHMEYAYGVLADPDMRCCYDVGGPKYWKDLYYYDEDSE